MRTPAPPCKSPLQRRNPGGFPTSASPCPTAAFQNLHQHHGTSSLEVVLIATGLKASVVLPSKPSQEQRGGSLPVVLLATGDPLVRCPSLGNEIRPCKELASLSLVGTRPSPTHPCPRGGGDCERTR